MGCNYLSICKIQTLHLVKLRIQDMDEQLVSNERTHWDLYDKK